MPRWWWRPSGYVSVVSSRWTATFMLTESMGPTLLKSFRCGKHYRETSNEKPTHQILCCSSVLTTMRRFLGGTVRSGPASDDWEGQPDHVRSPETKVRA